MNELITKQQAIDVADKYLDADGCNGSDVAQDIIADLMALPSAEPQIIHCRDCKNLEIDSIFHDCWCNGHKVWLDHYCGYAERKTDGQI